METDLLHCVRDIRPGEGEVLKRTGQTPESSGISNWRTLSSRDLGLSVNRSGARLAVSHPSTLQDVQNIVLPLLEEDTVWPLLNCDTQEVMKLTEILHGKLSLKG